MSKREPKSFKVQELKKILKDKGLSIKGGKIELINRLLESDFNGEWLLANDQEPTHAMTTENNEINDEITTYGAMDGHGQQASAAEAGLYYEREGARAMDYQREIELYRREKELAEKELALERRELELLRVSQRNEGVHVDRTAEVSGSNSPAASNVRGTSMMVASAKVNVKMVADLLSEFNGQAENFETWERQVRFLQTAYDLDNNLTKILIGTRLKGRALNWFHSKADYIELTADELLIGLREMFYHRPDQIVLRRRFEERVWKEGETFHDYVHEKTIMANRIAVRDAEILGYIIDGIPDLNLRDLAKVRGFTTREEILQAFQEIRLEDRRHLTSSSAAKGKDDGATARRKSGAGFKDIKDVKSEKKFASDRKEVTKRCYNCGDKDHVSANCPLKEKGVKCFECNEHGHVAAKCPRKQKVTTNNCVVAQSQRRKHFKDVLINDVLMQAIVDTGSDITIMRADEFIKIGSPDLVRKSISFSGIGKGQNATIGEFRAKLTVDGNSYAIDIHVVSDELSKHGFLIGNDFLDTVELNVRCGIATISPVTKDDVTPAEIYQITIGNEFEASPVDLSHIQNNEHASMIRELIDNYKPLETRDIGVQMKLILSDDEPVNLRPRRLAAAEKNEVNAQIDEWLKAGIVRPSVSDYASPIVLAKKKDGSTRICIDYRLLNKKIIKDRYPLPLIEDQLDALQGAKIFSTLDLKNGFFHVSVDESSKKYTAFMVPDGHYEFNKVPFGLCNSPAVFQKFINTVFNELARERVVLIYLDDLIVPSSDYDSAIVKLKRVLQVASENGLIINWKKCSMLQTRVDYLGYVIENGHICPSERKIVAVKNFPVPSNIRQVQQFLGLTGYFRKFVPGYSIMARPLTNLLKTGVEFKFESLELNAFDQLKLMLVSNPVLNLYRIGAETELHTDASSFGYGAILLQRSTDDNAMHPVYYASGKTTPTEQKYISYELEVLAIVKALKKFRVYLLHVPFKIVTDCRAFTLTMAKRDLCLRIARWALMLEDYNYKLEHRPGKSMSHVDALSRNPLPTCLLLDETDGALTVRFRKAQAEDESIQKIIQLTEKGEKHGYSIRSGLLFKEVESDNFLVVPKAMCLQIIRRAHERGHFSVAKTEAIVRKDYYIQGLRPKVEKVIRNCINCILANKRFGKQEGFLSPIDKGEVPLDTYHIDHLGPLASTKKNYRHIFVVVDGFSKFTWLYATKSTGTAEVLDRLKRQAAIFGNPRRIISDRGTAFTANDFVEYCKQEKIEHVLTTTGIPRANGQVERVNRVLITLLIKLSAPKPEDWHSYLNVAQQYFNMTVQRSISMTPFQLLFGTHARLREDDNVRELLEQEWASSFNDKRDELRTQARDSITNVQQENKRIYDKKRKTAQIYREGDLVAIRRTQSAPGMKLAIKYLGPYEVKKVLRSNRYLVYKVGEHEGPQQTSSSADYMKPWLRCDSDETDSEDDNGASNG